MRFAYTIFPTVFFLSTLGLTQGTPANMASSRVAKIAIPPSEAFSNVLETYHASLGQAQTRAVKVVAASPEDRAATPVEPARKVRALPTKVVQVKFYEAGAVNTSLTSLKSDILTKVPVDDKPLRHYIEAKFPSTPAAQNGYIAESDVDLANKSAEGLVMELRSAGGFALDLKVKSNAESARFTYVGEFDPNPQDDELSVYTDNTIAQMWRGPYTYAVSRKGYWTVRDKFNTIVQKGDTVECSLVAKQEPEGGQCILK
jgi:hypothetical protein